MRVWDQLDDQQNLQRLTPRQSLVSLKNILIAIRGLNPLADKVMDTCKGGDVLRSIYCLKI